MAARAIRIVAIPKSLRLALARARSSLARATLNLRRVHFPYRFFPSPLLARTYLVVFRVVRSSTGVPANVNAPIWGSFGADKRTTAVYGAPDRSSGV